VVRWRRWSWTTVVVLLTGWLAATLLLGAGSATASASDEAAQFVAAINGSRASLAGVGALQSKSDLTDVANRHAAEMAAAGSIFHNPALGSQVSGWEVLGENVGVGTDVAGLHQAFLDSPAHRANLLDGRFTEVGIGIAHTSDSLWVVEVFRKPVAPAAAAPAPVASTPTAAPAAAPAPVAAPAPAPKRVVAPRPAPAPAPVAVVAPAPAPAPVVETPAPAPEPVPAPVVFAPTADELADQAAAHWGAGPAAHVPTPAVVAAVATTHAGTVAPSTTSPLLDPKLAATALWLTVAALTVTHLRRRPATGLVARPAGLSLQAA
jgi:hypothetical protein